MTMKLTSCILAMAMTMGAAWAQNPDAIDNARSIAKSLQQKQANDTNAALDAAGVPAAKQSPKPAATAQSAAVAASPAKSNASSKPSPKTAAVAAKPVSQPAKAVSLPTIAAVKTAGPSKPAKVEEKKEEKKWAMTGKRDPFFSPVVQQVGGSGCSTGKKCLEIGNINVRGVVKSDAGFIAVVTNNMNKAYFLRENDPVFNGYVVRITGDSVVFQETLQDKLGKPFTREVVKRLLTPAV
jgi:Tfp pilus assembly protein PilP